MRIFCSILLFFVTSLSFSQCITITGKLYSFSDNYTLSWAAVFFDGMNWNMSDSTGKFKLIVDREILNDTLKIKYFGFRSFYIINIPIEEDTINLGNIPLFDHVYYHDHIADFFCRWYEFRRKQSEKLYWKNIYKENLEHINYTNQSIESFKFILYNKKYYLNYFDNLEGLPVLLDLSKPERQ